MMTIFKTLFLVGLLLSGNKAFAQDEDERRLWDSEFLKKRAPAKSTAARKPDAYKRVTSKVPAAKTDTAIDKIEGEMIGITIWRLRQPASNDVKDTRLLLTDEESKEKVEWTPERVEAETIFVEGDRVRLSIESPRDGYLYVIDREQYADGTLSDPYLIFPMLRYRDGDNYVKAGKVIEIPEKSAFRLKPLRADYRGESLTLLVTKEPLPDVKPGPSIVKLDGKVVEGWEKQWGSVAERFELIGGAGKTYTKTEKEAGQDGSRILTQEDELPQTLYRIIPKPGQPLLINVPLKIGK